MVGTGWRSGACQTCRRRRVKCDQTQPWCQRCAKANITCEGYARDLKFVDEKQKAQKRVQIKREAYLQAVQAEEEELQARRRARSLNGGLARISLKGFQDDIQLSYMQTYFMAGAKMHTQWMMQLYTGREDCTSTQTIRALSSVYFGRLKHHQESVDMGMIYYSKALHLLGADLKDPATSFNIRNMSNVLSLCLFEMIASPSGIGFVGHLDGVTKLIEAFQPERFQTQPELFHFEIARLASFFCHMDRRKRNVLEHPKWKTVPWQKHPEAKFLASRLSDHLVDLPGILEDMEALRTRTRATPENIADLCQRVGRLLHDIYIWRGRWEAENPGCCTEVQCHDPRVPFDKVLHFNLLQRISELSLYNTALLVLLRCGRLLMGPSFSSIIAKPIPRTNAALLLPSDSKTVQDVAREILRCVEYAFQEKHINAGCFQMLFPVRATLEVFGKGSREWKYIERTFEEIANKGGYQLSRGIAENVGCFGRWLSDEGVYG